jgi:hypothetical protein
VTVYDQYYHTSPVGEHLFSIYDIGNAFKAGAMWADKHPRGQEYEHIPGLL